MVMKFLSDLLILSPSISRWPKQGRRRMTKTRWLCQMSRMTKTRSSHQLSFCVFDTCLLRVPMPSTMTILAHASPLP
jgi:hypothetical protein